MNKILIFGASGLLGNAMYKHLSSNQSLDVYGTINDSFPHFVGNKKITNLNILDYQETLKTIENIIPEWIINCVADTRPEPDDLSRYFFINSIFPQLLSHFKHRFGYRLIHFSSNGVFSGDKKQSYNVKDIPDARDIYGISKVFSEKIEGKIIRTSIIGHSLDSNNGLLDWFLNTKEKEVYGYSKVYWNGITTLTLSKVVERIIKKNIILNDTVTQIVSEKISKYELLKLFGSTYGKSVTIKEEGKKIIDQTLNPSPEQENHFSDLIGSLSFQIEELKSFYGK